MVRVDPTAEICESVVLYDGCVIGKFTHIYHHTILLSDTIVGDYTKIGCLCFSQGPCRIGNWVTVLGQCSFTIGLVIEDGVFMAGGVQTANCKSPGGRVHLHEKYIEPPLIKKGARIGSGAIILPGVVVGQEALVGAGSVVVKNVPPFMVVVGNPAKIIREVGKGERIDWSKFG